VFVGGLPIDFSGL